MAESGEERDFTRKEQDEGQMGQDGISSRVTLIAVNLSTSRFNHNQWIFLYAFDVNVEECSDQSPYARFADQPKEKNSIICPVLATKSRNIDQ